MACQFGNKTVKAVSEVGGFGEDRMHFAMKWRRSCPCILVVWRRTLWWYIPDLVYSIALYLEQAVNEGRWIQSGWGAFSCFVLEWILLLAWHWNGRTEQNITIEVKGLNLLAHSYVCTFGLGTDPYLSRFLIQPMLHVRVSPDEMINGAVTLSVHREGMIDRDHNPDVFHVVMNHCIPLWLLQEIILIGRIILLHSSLWFN